jgi:DNA modification methylase
VTIDIRIGDCRDVLRQMPADSVHCCVTSPPYFGLRDYGTAQWDGGDAECDHKQTVARHDGGRVNVDGFNGSASASSDKGAMNYRDTCGKCGARRIDRQIGLEPTPDAFVAEMVAVFAEVRRVLRDDGVLWLNLGDSYASGGRANYGFTDPDSKQATHPAIKSARRPEQPPGLKPKDLIGIPWRVAFALQADGWYLRQDIIWSKPNPMPESVTDRCTKAHEYLFLLSKSPRYWYDAEAISEPALFAGDMKIQGEKSLSKGQANGAHVAKSGNALRERVLVKETRNKRSVWEIPTSPYPEAHFATFPPALIEPCIKAGCPVGGTVLDPFGGAGTTGLVADRLGRNAILIELNPAYADMARRRIEGDAGMFAEVAAQ